MTNIIIRTEDQETKLSGISKKSVNGVVSILDLDTEVQAGTMKLLARKPDRTTITPVDVQITNPGSGDGKFHYTTTGAFFTGQKQGYWHFQTKFTLTDGKILHSDIVRILVGEVIGE